MERYSEPIDVHHPGTLERIGKVYRDRQTGCWIAALTDGAIYMDECGSYEEAHAELTYFVTNVLGIKEAQR